MGEEKNNLTHGQDKTGNSMESNESVSFWDAAGLTALAEPEIAFYTREQAGPSREKAVTLREDGLNLREEAADLREEAADLREEAADLREEAASLDAKTLHAEIKTANARKARSELTESQLRESNENLLAEKVNAQTMIDDAEQATAEMTHMAEHDFLTGLPNRVLLTDRLLQAIMFARRYGKKVALMYLDLDHFKQINDSFGHGVGDQLLQSVAKRLQACVRLSDTVSRQGGDEFVVLLSEIDGVKSAVLIAEKLIKAMAEPHIIGDHRLFVTLSIGISLYPDDGKNVEAVIRNADTAMYHAKKSGRNSYQVFTSDMNICTVARQAMEEGLRQALDQGRFVLHYQPKVNLETRAIIGVEALLRWQKTDYSLVESEVFMGIAEESGLIIPIGRWVLREACRQTQTWLEIGLKLGQIAVNVSAKEFLGKDFLADVTKILAETGLDPHLLEIELTEGGLMHDVQQTMVTLSALKELGVQIAIDGFGTGYSSLANLMKFPIDTLKIDESFVQDIGGGEGEVVVSAIISMGRSFNAQVVAGGIETLQQLTFLKSHGCPEGQGYYFGRPVAAGKLATLL